MPVVMLTGFAAASSAFGGFFDRLLKYPQVSFKVVFANDLRDAINYSLYLNSKSTAPRRAIPEP
jgi:hypothetical protein